MKIHVFLWFCESLVTGGTGLGHRMVGFFLQALDTNFYKVLDTNTINTDLSLK